MARQLILVRHARVAAEYAGRYVGSTDLAPSPEGLREAKALAPLIQARKPGRCFASPMLRTRRTAERLWPATNGPVQMEDDLREIDFGLWEGKTFPEVAAGWPAEVNRWAEFAGDFAFPGGESLRSFTSRINRMADRLAADPADVVMAVTHGGVIRGMICHFLGLVPRRYVLFEVRCATAATITLFDGKGVLSGLNETGSMEVI
jgi:broad specificity phosphatase PhoE